MKLFFNVIGLVLILLSCSDPKPASSTDSINESQIEGVVKIDGSSTVYPITEAVAEEYRSVQPKVKVTIGISGTGGGFKKFSRGETDISDASRPIKQKEIDACNKNGIEYIQLSVAYDGIAVLTNPQNDWVDYFTTKELKKLWETEAQGMIMKWNQIRPEWPNEEIHLYGPGTASGTYDYFAEAICGKKVGTRGDYTASEDDNVLVQGIANDKFSLGFFGLAYYEENKEKLNLIGVDNGNGPILPNLETVGSGTYAPLSRPIFIYVSNKANLRTEVKSFVEFYMNNAASLSEEVGYIPLPQTMYNEQKERYSNFN